MTVREVAGGRLWVLHGVDPLPGALEALLAAAEDHPDAALLAPQLLTPDGEPLLPAHWPHYGRVREVIDGAERRVLPLRAAGYEGVLLAPGAGRPHGDAWGFTARLLRDRPGWLVPAAKVRLHAPYRPPSPRATARAAGVPGAWAPRERVDRLVQAAVSAAARRRSTSATADRPTSR